MLGDGMGTIMHLRNDLKFNFKEHSKFYKNCEV